MLSLHFNNLEYVKLRIWPRITPSLLTVRGFLLHLLGRRIGLDDLDRLPVQETKVVDAHLRVLNEPRVDGAVDPVLDLDEGAVVDERVVDDLVDHALGLAEKGLRGVVEHVRRQRGVAGGVAVQRGLETLPEGFHLRAARLDAVELAAELHLLLA